MRLVLINISKNFKSYTKRLLVKIKILLTHQKLSYDFDQSPLTKSFLEGLIINYNIDHDHFR